MSQGVRVRVPSSANMLNFEKIRTITENKQHEIFETNKKSYQEEIDEGILLAAQNGFNQLWLERAEGSKVQYKLQYKDHYFSFVFTKGMYKAIKKEYVKLGFKVKKRGSFITFSWF